MKIVIFGLGYVGSSLAVMLSRHNDVYVTDLDSARTDAIRNGKSPIGDLCMEKILKEENLNLTVSHNLEELFFDADYIVVATNTSLNEETGTLNTEPVESVIGNAVKYYTEADEKNRPVIIIKSTVPVGYTKSMIEKYPDFTFLFCPEFLREKNAMEDRLQPNRLVAGCDEKNKSQSAAREAAGKFAEIVLECSSKPDIPVVFTGTEEAEAIKLFSNSYLATRIAFFNQLDSFAKCRGLSTDDIIHGVCLDQRIGDWYNVPGPGYDGACLPKDIAQLTSDFGDLPEALFKGVIKSNELRKEYVAKDRS